MADEIVTTKALMFGKYDSTEVVVNDGGLAKYIDLTPTNVPHSGGKHANRWFGKSKLSIVERLINNIMRTEKYTGKKMKAYKAVSQAFDIIAAKTLSRHLRTQHPVRRSQGSSSEESPFPKQWMSPLRGGSTSHSVTSVQESSTLHPRTRSLSTNALQMRSCSLQRVI